MQNLHGSQGLRMTIVPHSNPLLSRNIVATHRVMESINPDHGNLVTFIMGGVGVQGDHFDLLCVPIKFISPVVPYL
jgi:hypothetical protein